MTNEEKTFRLRITAFLLITRHSFFADSTFFNVGAGIINKVKISVQELGDQRGEGAIQ